jgi:hypothetical protein
MKHFLSLFSSRRHYAVALIIVYLVIGMGTQACAATEAKQTANEVKKIEKEALLPGDIKVVKPHEELDEHLKALSGYWYGTWIGILPCQLVVETIDAKEAVVVFCWGDHPGGDYLGNWGRFKAKVSLPGKIEFNFLDDFTYFLDDSTFTFELDPAKDVLKGKQFSPSRTDESTMYRMNAKKRLKYRTC